MAQAQLDQANAKLSGAEAAIKSREAALRTAKLNLSYTDIVAPIDGRIGRAAYSVGDLVGPSSDPLATLVSQDPIYATFTITQRQLLNARQQMRDEGIDPSQSTIKLRLADGSIYDKTGTIGFISNQIDPDTDSITVRAKLPNPNGELIDGQLVQVVRRDAKRAAGSGRAAKGGPVRPDRPLRPDRRRRRQGGADPDRGRRYDGGQHHRQ